MYVKHLTLREISDVLGVSESRVCQIHGTLKRRLREILDADVALFSESPDSAAGGDQGDPLAMLADAAQQRRVGVRPLEQPVQVVLPGEADAAVGLDRRGVTWRPASAAAALASDAAKGSRSGSAPAAHAAKYVAERAPSVSSSIWAQRCETAW